MAILFLEGFDTYLAPGVSDSTNAWARGNNWMSVDPGFSSNPYGQGLRSDTARTGHCYNQGKNGSFDRGLGKICQKIGTGFAFRPNSLNTSLSITASVMRILTTAGVSLVYLRTKQGNTFDVVAGSTIIYDSSTAGLALEAFAWHHIELWVELGAAGRVAMRLNSQLLFDVTANISSASGAGRLAGFSPNAVTDTHFSIDDWFAYDDTGTANNAPWFGDCRMRVAQVNADEAAFQQWSRSTGTSSSALVQSKPHSDTTYLEAATAGQQVGLEIEDLALDGRTIRAVQTNFRSSSTDGDTKTLRPIVVGSNGNTLPGTDVVAPTGGYGWNFSVIERDPATNDFWTIPGFNATKLRIERTT